MMKVVVEQELEMFLDAAREPRWIEALHKEMEALSNNKTWDLAALQPHK